MNPVKKLLVPIDFSDYTPQVVAFAADLSRRYQAPLELMHAWETTTYVRPECYIVMSDDDIARINKDLEQKLAKVAESATAAGAIGVESRVHRGYPATAIVDRAKQLQGGMIVMGTHGRAGLKHLLVGSVAENVVRTAPCPVFTVRSIASAA